MCVGTRRIATVRNIPMKALRRPHSAKNDVKRNTRCAPAIFHCVLASRLAGESVRFKLESFHKQTKRKDARREDAKWLELFSISKIFNFRGCNELWFTFTPFTQFLFKFLFCKFFKRIPRILKEGILRTRRFAGLSKEQAWFTAYSIQDNTHCSKYLQFLPLDHRIVWFCCIHSSNSIAQGI